MFQIKKDRIYVKPIIGDLIYVGEIKDGYFKNTDKDNYHKSFKALGIDKELLYSKELKYRFITMKFQGRNLITTRKYFADLALERKLLNGRQQVFLPISEFGIAKALKHESSYSYEKLAEMSIFDVLPKQDPRLFEEWQRILEEQQEIEDKTQTFKSKRIEI